MSYSLLGLFHLFTAITALISGALVFYSRKGTRRHKQTGYTYTVSMVIVIVSAFSTYNSTGSFNILHLAALISAVTLSCGMYFVLRKKKDKDWLPKHYMFMIWSYIGLFAAFISESATRIGVPYLERANVESFVWFWAIVGLASFLVVYIGILLIQKNKHALERYHPKRI
jgi:uncharacterized membrane protein